ncbi:DUF1800 domain-containing protein [Lysobacter fragariae]
MDTLSAAQRAQVREFLQKRYGGMKRRPRTTTTWASAPAVAASATTAGSTAAAKSFTLPTGGPTPADWITLPLAPLAVRVLGHLSYGATLTTLNEFTALGSTDDQRIANYVEWQLDWSAIDDSALDARLANAGYTTLGKSLPQLWTDHVLNDPPWDVRMRPAWEVQRAAFARAVFSRRQLREVVVNFWHDHFNVTATEGSAGPVYAHYDRDVLRQHAFGNFRQMLEGVATSTAMLYYLDNIDNTRAGPNENFARELLELHTFGAEHYLGFTDPFDIPPCPEDPSYPSGYCDIDVYETASAFTGWTAKNGHWEFPSDDDGTFVYRQSWHDAGPKFVLGRLLNPEQPAMKDGRDILDRLASHPYVAKFICSKLVRRFVSDTPDPTLVASAAVVFRQNWQAPDQIEKVLRHILLSPKLQSSWGNKQRRPFEAMVAAMRTLGGNWTLRVDDDKSDEFMWRMGYTGHLPYEWPAPNGYPDIAQAWSGSNSYAMTWKMLNWFTESMDTAGTTPLAAILAISRNSVASWTANNLVTHWCQRLLGYQPAAARKQAFVHFLAQNGDPATYVIADTDSWSGNDLKQHYNQQRLRSMVSLILLSPEFLSR